ncbi:MBL fold metallo-hydrolase [Streptococcus dentiloxodontae]
MNIERILNPVAMENTYILENDQACLVIDPGSNQEKILETLQQIQKPVTAILLTHTHYDHIMSVEAIRKHCQQPPVYVAEAEKEWLSSPVNNLSGLPRHADMADVIVAPAEHFFQYEKPYHLTGFDFKVVPTPGHSIGGVSFIFEHEALVFSGDALFRETIGRSDLPTGDYEQLLNSIRQKLFTLPNHYLVYPGHGWDTTIGHEKNFNPHFN